MCFLLPRPLVSNIKILISLVHTYKLASMCISHLQDIFYSRKNFNRPELQSGIHRDFDQEVAYLDKIFSSKLDESLIVLLSNVFFSLLQCICSVFGCCFW